jgi:hypothetical protein
LEGQPSLVARRERFQVQTILGRQCLKVLGLIGLPLVACFDKICQLTKLSLESLRPANPFAGVIIFHEDQSSGQNNGTRKCLLCSLVSWSQVARPMKH